MVTDEELFNLEKEKNVASPLGSVKHRVLKLMQLARADAVEGRDAELLKQIQNIKINYQKRIQNNRRCAYVWALDDIIELLSPKPEEKKKGD